MRVASESLPCASAAALLVLSVLLAARPARSQEPAPALPYSTYSEKSVADQAADSFASYTIPDGQCSGDVSEVGKQCGDAEVLGLSVLVRDATRFPSVRIDDSLRRATVQRAPRDGRCPGAAEVEVRAACSPRPSRRRPELTPPPVRAD